MDADGLDLVELSNRAWTIIDPLELYEGEERRWVRAITSDGNEPAATPDLDGHLARVVDSLPAGQVPATLIAAVMSFLAARPDARELSEGMLQDAIDDRYAGERLPPDVAAFVEARRTILDAHVRRHGAPQRRRHFHSRPAPSDLG